MSPISLRFPHSITTQLQLPAAEPPPSTRGLRQVRETHFTPDLRASLEKLMRICFHWLCGWPHQASPSHCTNLHLVHVSASLSRSLRLHFSVSSPAMLKPPVDIGSIAPDVEEWARDRPGSCHWHLPSTHSCEQARLSRCPRLDKADSLIDAVHGLGEPRRNFS